MQASCNGMAWNMRYTLAQIEPRDAVLSQII
jgi:hypothetical protein